MNLKNTSAISRLKSSLFKSVGLVSIAAFVTLFFYLPCANSETKTPAPQIMSGPAKIFYQIQEKEKCVWSTYDLANDKTVVLLDKVKKCTPNIFFHKTKQEGYLFVDNTAYRFTLGGDGGKIDKLAEISGLGQMVTPVVAKNGAFRIGHIVPISDDNVIEKEKEKKTYYKYKGKLYLDDNPPMGSPAIAEVYELKNGKFESIAITSTQFESEGTPGLFVVLDKLEASNDYVSVPTLIKNGQCSEQDCTDLTGWNSQTKKNIKKVLGLDKTDDDPSSDEPGFVSSGVAGKGLAAQVVWGDTAHYSPPVYFCDKFCETSNVVDGVELQQISITSNGGDYFLLADEFTNNEALILKFGTNTPLKSFPKSLYAVWANDIQSLMK